MKKKEEKYKCNDCNNIFNEDIIKDYNGVICPKCYGGDVAIFIKFTCTNCQCKSINKGYYFLGSNIIDHSILCRDCEKEFYKQNKEDNEYYNSVRI